MKLSETTLRLLKSLSQINHGLKVDPGSALQTINSGKTIIAYTKTDQEFESPFCIGELPKFLSTLSLFEDPDLVFGEKAFTIKQGNRRVSYTYADPAVITTVPDGAKFKAKDPLVTVKIPHSVLDNVKKAQAIMKLPELVIIGDGKKVSLAATDTKVASADNYAVELEADKPGKFKVVYRAENILTLPLDYDVAVTKQGFSTWESGDTKYVIVVEQHSELG